MNFTRIAKTRTPVVIVGLGALLGSTIVWTKLLTGYLTTAQIVSSRVLLAGLTMFALLAVKGRLRRPGRALLRGTLVLGLIDSVFPYLLMAFAARQVEAGLGAVLIATMPLFTTLFAFAAAREVRMSVAMCGALAFGLAGVTIIAAPAGFGIGNGLQAGHAALLAASAMLGAATVYGRRLLEEADALQVSAWKLAWASILVVPATLAIDGMPDARAFAAGPLLAMLFAGVVSTGIGRMAYLWASGVIGGTRVSLVTYVMPGAGLLTAWLVLGERPAPTTLAGFALVIASLVGIMPGIRGRIAGQARKLRQCLTRRLAPTVPMSPCGR